jgi:ABC-type lipoprotein release transport system permease subunit
MMNPIRWAILRLRAVVARRALERDMQEEMREHLERATERYVARGMSPADARLAARRLSIVALKLGLAQGVIIAPEVSPYLIGVVIAPLLVAVAAAATWMPARRAALVDPARTLRVE